MLLGGALAILTVGFAAAGPVNPDISVIGDTRAFWSEEEDEVELLFHELEIALVGPLNPYASAEVYLGIHGSEGIEIEEAKLLLDRYFPAGLGLTAGRFLLDFGQLNQIHVHAFPFVARPLMHTRFFGDDGALDTGVRLDWLAPVERVTLRATVAALRGDVVLGGHHHDHAHEEDEHEEHEGHEAEPEIGLSGRLELFSEPSRDFSFLAGASVLHGEFDPEENARATWLTGDLKARWELGPSRALVVNAEAVWGRLEARSALEEELPGGGVELHPRPEVNPSGWFAAADLRLTTRWNLGGFAESATERLHDDHRTHRYGAFVGLALMEETTLFRLLTRRTDPDEGAADTELLLQAIFGLGPHKAHRY
jgi:hypothetical protein